jgi:hypothetical protein
MAAALALTLLGALPAQAGERDEGWPVEFVRAPEAVEGKLNVPVVPPGAEGRIEALLAPVKIGGAVTAGWFLKEVTLGRFITLNLVKPPAEDVLSLAIYPAEWLGHPLCEAGGLGLVARAATPDEVVKALCATLEGGQVGEVFTSSLVQLPRNEESQDRVELEGGRTRLRWTPFLAVFFGHLTQRVLFLALAALLVLTFRRAWRLAPPHRAEALALLGLVAGGALVRALLPEFTLLKEAYPFRGFDSIAAGLLDTGGQTEVGMPVIQHAVAGLLYHLLPWLHVEQAMRWATFILSSLTPAVLYLALRTWTPSSRAPLLAALLLAFLPLHVKYTASEAVTPALVFYLSASLLALGLALRRPSWLAWLTLGLTQWFLFQVRPEAPLLALVFPLAAYLLADGPRGARLGLAARALLPTLVALAPAFVLQLSGGPAAGTLGNILSSQLDALGRFFQGHNVFLNLHYTPALLVLAALTGVVALARTRRPVLGVLGLLLLSQFAVYGSIVSDVLPFGECRYQVALSVAWVGLAAYGLEAWLSLRPLRLRAPFLGLALVALAWLGNCAWYLGFVQDASYDRQAEFRFFTQQVRPLLEESPACPVMLLPFDRGSFKDLDGREYASIVEKGEQLTAVDAGSVGEVKDAPCALFFRGLFCEYAHDPGARRQNESCAAILGAPGVTAVLEEQTPNRPFHAALKPVDQAAESFTLGLYRVPLPLPEPAKPEQ